MVLSATAGVRVDYAVLADAESLQPVAVVDELTRLRVSRCVSKVRLMDKCALRREDGRDE